MRTIFLSQAAASAAFAARSATPAAPGYSWTLGKIAGMQMWFVCQTWNAANLPS